MSPLNWILGSFTAGKSVSRKITSIALRYAIVFATHTCDGFMRPWSLSAEAEYIVSHSYYTEMPVLGYPVRSTCYSERRLTHVSPSCGFWTPGYKQLTTAKFHTAMTQLDGPYGGCCGITQRLETEGYYRPRLHNPFITIRSGGAAIPSMALSQIARKVERERQKPREWCRGKFGTDPLAFKSFPHE